MVDALATARTVLLIARQRDEFHDLCGTILATLRLNQRHLFRDDAPAAEIFGAVLERWKESFASTENMELPPQ